MTARDLPVTPDEPSSLGAVVASLPIGDDHDVGVAAKDHFVTPPLVTAGVGDASVAKRPSLSRLQLIAGVLFAAVMAVGPLYGGLVRAPSPRGERNEARSAAATSPAPEVGPLPTQPRVEGSPDEIATIPDTGTLKVTGKSGRRIFVDDDAVGETPSVTVKCGVHRVRVGAGKPKSVDVPCGGEINLR